MAFVSVSGERVREERDDLSTVSAGGGPPTALAQPPSRNANLVGWTAGGKSLIVSEEAGTSTRLYAVPTDGASAQAVGTDEGVYGAISHSRPAGRPALTYQSSAAPAEASLAPRELHSTQTHKCPPWGSAAGDGST